MEPLIELNIADTNTNKKRTKSAARTCIGNVEAAKVKKWIEQVSESSNGFLTLTTIDLLNYIVQEMKDVLSPLQLSRIKIKHYDPVKHIDWIGPQIKEALKNADPARVAALQDEIKSIRLIVEPITENPIGTHSENLDIVGDERKSRRRKTRAAETLQVTKDENADL